MAEEQASTEVAEPKEAPQAEPTPQQAETRRAILFREDEPTPEPNTDDVPTSEEEDAANDKAEATTDEATKPSRGRENWDKELSRIQQIRSQAERELTQLQGLRKQIDGQGGEATAEQQNQLDKAAKRVTEANAKLERLAPLGDESGALDREFINPIIDQNNKLLDIIEQLEAKFSTVEQTIQERAQEEQFRQQEVQAISKWDKDNPEVAGRFDELYKKAAEKVAKDYPNADETTFPGLVTYQFDTLVRQVKQGKASASGPTPPAPPSKKPPTDAVGTRVVHPGASATKGPESKPRRTPLWVPDNP